MNKQMPAVLVVDDLPLNRMLVTVALKQLGCLVLEVGDGSQAVAALREGNFALVVMDCHMPVMDGLAATLEIRAGNCSIPILAYTTEDNREDCLRAGMDDYLSKPAPLGVLKGKLSHWLERAA